MIAVGIDIGSTSCKAVALADGAVAAVVVGPAGAAPGRRAEDVLELLLRRAGCQRADIGQVIGTGYGRALVPFADDNVSELTCHGRGAVFAVPGVRTVLDIGGQDTKAIRVDDHGLLVDYAMNDKCAAGTGRFLEAMARTLDVSLEDLDGLSVAASSACGITSMCSVFAESEVINLINEGIAAEPIARGLHEAMAGRVATLVRRVGLEPELVVTGGVAKSEGVLSAVARRLGVEPVRLPAEVDPQVIGALGAALVAAERC